jgi:hypothetical protein
VLIADPAEQAVIAEMVQLRDEGQILMAIKAAMAERGFPLSHLTVSNLIQRAGLGAAA